jgi:hypothetical protein
VSISGGAFLSSQLLCMESVQYIVTFRSRSTVGTISARKAVKLAVVLNSSHNPPTLKPGMFSVSHNHRHDSSTWKQSNVQPHFLSHSLRALNLVHQLLNWAVVLNFFNHPTDIELVRNSRDMFIITTFDAEAVQYTVSFYSHFF